MTGETGVAGKLTRLVGISVAITAFTVRLVPTLIGGKRSLLEYDDGVYLSAAIKMISGHRPYAAFTFVQPPGALYAFAPSAVLARATSEPWGMVAARITVAAAAAGTTWLIYRVVRPYGEIAAVAGAALYAVWQPAVLAGRTALLEPLVTLAVLAAVVVLADRASRQILSGILFAVACMIKLAAAPLLIVLLYIVIRRYGRAAALRWMAGGFGAGLILLAPFLLTAPRDLWSRVVVDQVSRPRAQGTFVDRIHFLSGWSSNPELTKATTVQGAALAAMLIVALAVVSAVVEPSARPWLAVALITLVSVMLAPSFYYHYVEPTTAPIAICLGFGFSRMRVAPSVTEAAVTAALLALLAVSIRGMTSVRNVPYQVSDALQAARCPWSMSASLTIAADVQHRVCGGRVDYFGDLLGYIRAGGGTSPVLNEAPGLDGFQSQLQTDFGRADVAVLEPGDRARWGPATIEAFDRRFHLRGSVHGFQIFASRPRTSTS